MLQMLAFTASTHGAELSPAETQRIGVYILAGLTGLLVTGLVACAKEFRRDMDDARLRKAQAKEQAARGKLNALAREMHIRAA